MNRFQRHQIMFTRRRMTDRNRGIRRNTSGDRHLRYKEAKKQKCLAKSYGYPPTNQTHVMIPYNGFEYCCNLINKPYHHTQRAMQQFFGDRITLIEIDHVIKDLNQYMKQTEPKCSPSDEMLWIMMISLALLIFGLTLFFVNVKMGALGVIFSLMGCFFLYFVISIVAEQIKKKRRIKYRKRRLDDAQMFLNDAFNNQEDNQGREIEFKVMDLDYSYVSVKVNPIVPVVDKKAEQVVQESGEEEKQQEEEVKIVNSGPKIPKNLYELYADRIGDDQETNPGNRVELAPMAPVRMQEVKISDQGVEQAKKSRFKL